MSAAKRKRPSVPASPIDSPAKRRGSAGGAKYATAADPLVSVTVEPPPGSSWCLAMRRPRDAGQFIDITLVRRTPKYNWFVLAYRPYVLLYSLCYACHGMACCSRYQVAGGRKIPAHKAVLVGLSSYLEGLLTSGLVESHHHGGQDLRIGEVDGRAVEAIVECMYSGELSLSRATVSNVIHAANLFDVASIEAAACDFFVDSLDPSTAHEALSFAAAHATRGSHAHELHKRCLEYVAKHFEQCSAGQSFLDLPCEVVAELTGSNNLLVAEEAVLAAVRSWYVHDAASRQASLKALIPLIRWPLLPVETQLKLWEEPLILRALQLDDGAKILVAKILLECSSHFVASDAARTCARLQPRRGTKLPLGVAYSVEGHPTGVFNGVYRKVSEHRGWPVLRNVAGKYCYRHETTDMWFLSSELTPDRGFCNAYIQTVDEVPVGTQTWRHKVNRNWLDLSVTMTVLVRPQSLSCHR
jgi:hypothetical protein